MPEAGFMANPLTSIRLSHLNASVQQNHLSRKQKQKKMIFPFEKVQNLNFST